MRFALAIGTFLILVIHGVVFYNQFSHKWERYQIAYFDQARSLARSDAEKAALADRSPRIEQIVISDFGETRVDRCTTCHIASDDPRFASYAQPLQDPPLLRRPGRHPEERQVGAPAQVRRVRLHRLPRRPGPGPAARATPTARTSSGPIRCSATRSRPTGARTSCPC